MLSKNPWQLEAVLRLGAGLMLGLALFSSLGLLFHQFLPETVRQQLSLLDILLSTLSFHGVALVLVHLFLRHHRGIKWPTRLSWLEFLGLRHPKLPAAIWKGLLTGLGALLPALALKNFSALLIELVHMSPEEQAPIQFLQEATDWHQFIWFGLTAIVLAPVVEEILFRGVLYSFLKQRGRPALALWFSSLLFAAIHANLVTFIPLTFLALSLVWIYEHTDNLLAPILTHAFFNAVNFALLLLQLFLPLENLGS